MKTITEFLSNLTEPLGWTLLNSIWQALVIMALVVIVLRLVPLKMSRLRYVIACSGMVLILIMNIFTFLYIDYGRELTVAQTTLHPKTFSSEVLINSLSEFSFADVVTTIRSTVDSYMSLIILCWMAGAVFFILRMISGWFYVSLLKSEAVALNNEWSERLQELAHRLVIKQAVTLAESARINAPLVIGFLKPVVLIPVGMLAGLSTEQIETIFIHELAHIRRHDYVINLIQSFIEAIFFFNPFVWMLSAIIRREREYCCDDVVVVKHGSAIAYAHALAQLEEVRFTKSMFALSLAENKNQLLNRIKRLMENSAKNYSGKDRIIPALLLIAGFICASWLTVKSDAPIQDKSENKIAQDTSKKRNEKAARYYRKTITREDENGEPAEWTVMEYSGDEEQMPIDFDVNIPEISTIPDIDAMNSIPDISTIPSVDVLSYIQGIPSIEAIPGIPDMNYLPFGYSDQKWNDSIPSKHFRHRQSQDWEEFSEQFQKKFQEEFGDFYKTHEKDFEKMMEEMKENFATRFSEDAMMTIRDNAWVMANEQQMAAEHEKLSQEQLREIEEQARHVEEGMRDNMFQIQQDQLEQMEIQVRQQEEQVKQMEKQMQLFEKDLKKELIKDGYLKNNEELSTINWTDDGAIEINGKKIKEADLKKYHELHNKLLRKRNGLNIVE